MYGVIMAGGGGTRLRPLSRAERPKPFLPLLGERVAAPGDGRAPAPADRRHHGRHRPSLRADWSATSSPTSGLMLEPLGRNTAAAIALATLAIDRPDDEVMVVLPADHDHRARGRLPRRPARPRRTSLADRRVRHRGPARDPRRAAGPPGDRVRLPPARTPIAARTSTDVQAYPLRGFEEKPTQAPGRAAASARPGVAWNAGMFLWRRRAIRAALERYTGARPDDRADRSARRSMLERAYERIRSRSRSTTR